MIRSKRPITLALTGLLTLSLPLSVPTEVYTQQPMTGCTNPDAPITPEEERIEDGAPIPGRILKDSRFDQYVKAFERDLCQAPDVNTAKKLIPVHGSRLWQTAVDRAQGKCPDLGALDRYDDRPLYWARLHMTRTLRQWDPEFKLTESQKKTLIQELEYTTRGIRSIDFPKGDDVRRVLVSGFDPYRLEHEFRRSNPSGAAALQLDGKRIMTEEGPAVIQSALFPVRWQDFEEGIVEDTFGPYLKKGPERIDLMMTISQGRQRQMDIEGFAGRWHTGTDNNEETRDEEIPMVSRWPMPSPLPEFIETTLPVQAMIDADTGPWPVQRNDEVCEWLPPDFEDPYTCHDGGPTPGSKAQAGGGGNYLSNESQYRSNRLRVGLGAEDIPGGHLHNAALEFYPEDPSIYIDPKFREHRQVTVDQTVALVEAAARALD
ncbi:MAG: pyroglutamyl peptidase [Firmicutes bacterium]|nr:pyroglutamyl peptidase [Bacillota bacterium]